MRSSREIFEQLIKCEAELQLLRNMWGDCESCSHYIAFNKCEKNMSCHESNCKSHEFEPFILDTEVQLQKNKEYWLHQWFGDIEVCG